MADSRLEVVLGAGLLGSFRYPDVESCKTYCEMFRPYGSQIDHARLYPAEAFGKAEESMKSTGANEWATMDTKVTALGNKEHSKESIARSIDQSLEALGVDSIDIFYLHMPDHLVPFDETMKAVDEEYRKAKFKRLGLSNQSPAQVEELIRIAEKNSYVKPSVYQGHYNLVARKAETTLLPTLRKHGISFFAFAPSGVGIFSGNVNADSVNSSVLRWSNKSPIGKFWSDAYFKPEILDAATKIRAESEKLGMNGHHVALRWVIHHSALKKELGDAMIFASATLEQHKGNLAALDAGPLPPTLVATIESVWPDVKHVAPWAWIGDLSDDIRTNLEESR